LGDTIIEDGVKIDNQVQIGHNVRIGKFSIICAGVGIAGSVIIGSGVTLAGKVGIADHLRIADGVRIAGMSAVTRDVDSAGDYGGYPLLPARLFRRFQTSLESILDMNSEWRKERRRGE
jgi:UDP-3-O-[3-hydroxymyristoyl] glucosamine N-acyltransferase